MTRIERIVLRHQIDAAVRETVRPAAGAPRVLPVRDWMPRCAAPARKYRQDDGRWRTSHEDR